MEASILIVTKNRKEELRKTLLKLVHSVNFEKHEIRVFFDGPTQGKKDLKKEFPQIIWSESEVNVGASSARNILYKEASGKYLFGFDDDAHPLEKDFIEESIKLFDAHPSVGLIAFREIKGKYPDDVDIPTHLQNNKKQDFLTRDFLGCGFVVKNDVYCRTEGFPTWIDIYGEENCLSIEILALNQEILFTYKVSVNHRVDKKVRERSGAGFFRFEKQLKNNTYYYLVYYPFPLVIKKIGKLYFHNFIKYAIKDRRYFFGFWKVVMEVLRNSNSVLNFRKPVGTVVLSKIKELKNPEYHSN